MQWKVVHHGRKWRRVDNHMDCRHCPDCGATVNGNHGQREHQQWHIDQLEHEERLASTVEELCKRTGITEETVDLPWSWTAVVEDRSDQEALDVGLQAGLQRGTQPHIQARTRRRPPRHGADDLLPW